MTVTLILNFDCLEWPQWNQKKIIVIFHFLGSNLKTLYCTICHYFGERRAEKKRLLLQATLFPAHKVLKLTWNLLEVHHLTQSLNSSELRPEPSTSNVLHKRKLNK